MNEQERAEEHLKTIRRLMERATIYRAISAPTALVGGLLSLVACGVYSAWISRHPINPGGSPKLFLVLWLLVLLLTAVTNTLFICIGAKKRGEPVFSASMKAALIALAPPFMAGAIFTYAAGTDWNPGLDFVMSVLWATFYGLGLLATSHFAPRSLALLGWAFFLCGIAGVILLGRLGGLIVADGTSHAAIFFMAVTFGLFHLIYAACAWPRTGASPEL